jgi:ParB/RepB/Spo0J family partition protein
MSEQQQSSEPEESPTSAFDLPSSEPRLIETKQILLEDIAELANIRGVYHGIEGLAETMHLDGQLQACWVRPAKPDAEHGRSYELIFGYRRKRAVELLCEREVEGWDSLRCEVRDVPDGEELTKIIVENWQREAPSPVAEAKAMMALKESQDPPMTNTEIARQLGCDPSQISHRLSLLSLAMPEEESPAELEASDNDSQEPLSSSVDNTINASSIVPVIDQDNQQQASKEKTGTEKPTKKGKEKKKVDILQMVHDGEINPSTAEVIAGIDNREEQEQLALLSKKHDWSVKKATAWAKKAKEHRLDEGSDAEMGPIEMVTVDDVVDLPSLNVRNDLSAAEIKQVTLYILLRNSMDREVMDYLEIKMGVPFSSYWLYVRGLKEDQVQELINRMTIRYIGAAHRFSDIEPELKDDLGAPEDQPSDILNQDLSLPAAQIAEDRQLPEVNQEDDEFGEIDTEGLFSDDEQVDMDFNNE